MQARSQKSATRRGLVVGVVALGALGLTPVEMRAQSCTAPAFKLPATVFPVGLGPHGVAVLDFNRDGAPDAVAADLPGITVGLGNGAGAFLAPVGIPVPGFVLPYAVAVADFNLDGNPDVAVSDLGGNTLQAVLGDGIGGILPLPAPVIVGLNPVALAAGDFNRDGIPDLASANQSGSVQIVLGLGNGAFLPTPGPQILPVPGAPQDITAGDFNRDGFLDVAVADPGGVPGATLAFGDGLGGFGAFTRFGLPVAPAALAAGDVDNDGDLDVVVGDVATPQLMTLLGDGLGNLAPLPAFPNPLPLATSVVLADFDSDGRLDLGTAGLGSAAVGVGFGDGAGGFGGIAPFPVPEDPFGLAVGDFDKDGRPDIVGSGTPVSQVALLLNQFGIPCAKASFAGAGRLQVDLGSANPAAILDGHWDGDAIPDLAVAGNNSITILLGNGTLQFGTPSNIVLPFTNSPNDRRVLVKADFNLDSQPDLATVNPSSADINSDSVSVLINNGGGTFLGPTIIPLGANPLTLAAGDFNGDGAPDLVVSNSGSMLNFLPGQGDGTFGAAVPSATGVGGISAMAAGDIDGDLVLDLAVTHTSGNLMRWYKGDGAGGFALGSSHAVGSLPWSVDLGDLTGDGLPDVATANLLDDTVSVLVNTGGTFAVATPYAVGDEPHWVRIARANGDTFPDLVVPNRNTRDVSVLYGDGGGLFPSSTSILGFQNPEAALLVDADRNSIPDLAVANWDLAGGLYVLPGDGFGGFGPVQVSEATAGRSVGTGDFDRDGKVDLVTLDITSTLLSFLKGQGDGTFAPAVTFPAGLGSLRGIGVGDFDRNGTLDVVVGQNGINIFFVPGDGLGGFGPFISSMGLGSGSSRRRIATGDFDRDGALDIIRITSGNTVNVHYGNGAGGFVFPDVATGIGGTPLDIAVLDFNRDGILDLAVSNFTANTIWLLQGNGTRVTPFVQTLPNLATDAGPSGLAAGDFNGDGFPDLIVGQLLSSPGKMAYFPGLVQPGPGPLLPPFFGPRDDYQLDLADPDPDAVAAADVNGDGWLDAVVACRGGTAEERSSVRVLLGTGNLGPGLAFDPADIWATAQLSPWEIDVADFNNDGKPDLATTDLGGILNRVAVVLNSNCESRRLRATRNVSSCNAPLSPFAVQPAIQVEDHGGNPIQCNDAADPVSVGIIPGTGTGGAFLGGDNPLATTAGVADWATGLPLYIDLPGIKYRLQFTHPVAGRTFSRTLSLPPPLAVTGPDDFCAASGAVFSTDPGFDSYLWVVDPPGPDAGYASSLTIGPGVLAAGPHSVQVDATADVCPAPTGGKPFIVHADLSNVMAGLSGSSNICTTCTGGTASETHDDGWLVTHQWGYRLVTSGPITDIPGQTGSSYDLNGSDFPGVGNYFLVVQTTPTCGSLQVSNEIAVTITAAVPGDDVQYFTVTSRSTENVLEWVNPAGFDTTRIRYTSGASCTPPTDPLTSGALLVDKVDGDGPGDRDRHPHMGLSDGTTYCYTLFVDKGGSYSAGRSNRGRPMDTTGAIQWAFSTGVFSITAPTVGGAGVIAASNEPVLHSMERGLSGGEWPAGWLPVDLVGPVQSRSPIIPITVGTANPVVYLTSQTGHVHVVDGVQGGVAAYPWAPEPLGTFPTLPAQAAPAGMFTAFGGAYDYLLVGTRDGGMDNRVYAIDPVVGGVVDFFDNGGGASAIGIINGMASVDYPNKRLYFASHERGGAPLQTLWCLDLSGLPTPVMTLAWSRDLGDIDSSPVLAGGRVYVGSTQTLGTVHSINATTGGPAGDLVFNHADGQVKGFVFPDRATGDLYFATDNFVWALNDNGVAIANNFASGITLDTGVVPTSAVLFIPGSTFVYVGGSDGKLYEIDVSGGSPVIRSVVLGDGLATIGAPSLDWPNALLHVGTEAGVFYAVKVPFP